MGLTDLIAAYLIDAVRNGDGNLRRADIAGHFKCAPSQINYVISKRFTPEHGYIVESRRGEGGYIRISRVERGDALIMHTVNAIGDALSAQTAAALIQNLGGILKPCACRMLGAAIDPAAMRPIPPEIREEARAATLKRMLLQMANEEELRNERV